MRYGILVSDLFSSMGVSPMSSLRDGTWARRPCYCSSCRVREVVPPADDPVAGDVDEGDGLRLARLEPDGRAGGDVEPGERSEEHTSELQSQSNLVCRLLLEKKKQKSNE